MFKVFAFLKTVGHFMLFLLYCDININMRSCGWEEMEGCSNVFVYQVDKERNVLYSYS